MKRLSLIFATLFALAFWTGTPEPASAGCPYRTMTPSGQIVSSVAPEHSTVCVARPSPDCPECRAGFQHQCFGGAWRPIPSAPCGGGPRTAAPAVLPDQTDFGRDYRFRQEDANQRCIYYDRDGRRIQLNPEDLAWAKDNGLVVDERCYPAGRDPGYAQSPTDAMPPSVNRFPSRSDIRARRGSF